jgi:hypothetical protein
MEASMTAAASVQEISSLPDSVRSLTTLGATAGYTDTFVVDVPASERSAEAWGRLILEDAPASLRASLPPGWASLGLRHGPLDSEDHVLGWPIRDRTEDHLLLGAESRLGMAAELLFARWEAGLVFATVIRFDCAATRVLWAGIERPHKRIVRTLLTHAAEHAANAAQTIA